MPDLDLALEVLGLSGLVTELEAKRAYRALMLKWHPDLHQQDPAKHDEALATAKSINAAYERVSIEIERAGSIRGSTEPNLRASAAKQWTSSQQSPRRYQYTGPRTYRRRHYTAGFPDPTVFEVFVRSSNILSVGYSHPAKVLFIKFHDGAVYRYYGVPSDLFDALLAADSHGSFAHKRIYGLFRYERCH